MIILSKIDDAHHNFNQDRVYATHAWEQLLQRANKNPLDMKSITTVKAFFPRLLANQCINWSVAVQF